LIDIEQYQMVYRAELKKMTNEQVVSLLVLNVRNQQQKTKKYGMSKKQIDHVEKLSLNIMMLKEELIKRMGRKKKNDSRTD